MPTLRRLPRPASRFAILSCAALLISCGPTEPGEEPADTSLNNVARQAPSLPVAEPPLNRERLLLAAIRAGSASAAGADDTAAQRKLSGKRFEMRFRIGCGGAEAQDETRGWRFDEEKRTLRLRVTSDISGEDPVVAAIAAERFEGVEGVWIRRPWLLTPSCPKSPLPTAPENVDQTAKEPNGQKVQPAASPPGSPGWRVGIAQFFMPTDSRTGRRKQRPYETTKVLNQGQQPGGRGYDFVMAGRLRALSDGKVIACSANRPDAPPDCIISVHIDRVWIEQPDTRELIAEWGG